MKKYLILILLSIPWIGYSQYGAEKCEEKYLEWKEKHGDSYISWSDVPSLTEIHEFFDSITYTNSAKKAKINGEEFDLDKSKSASRFAMEAELGTVWQSRNDVQIPNDNNGSRFSLIDLLGNGPYPAGRLYLTWNINERHSVRMLAAPLSVTDTDVLEIPVNFSGEFFSQGVATEATYKFNSWRATYNYRFYQNQRFTWRIGFTAKIRDAKIRLEQAGKSAEKTDVGFVPLLNLNAKYKFSEEWYLLLDIDALAGGPGRAEDASLKLCYNLSPNWKLKAGYRLLEGGADVEEVYAFAWLHYAVLSVALSL